MPVKPLLMTECEGGADFANERYTFHLFQGFNFGKPKCICIHQIVQKPQNGKSTSLCCVTVILREGTPSTFSSRVSSSSSRAQTLQYLTRSGLPHETLLFNNFRISAKKKLSTNHLLEAPRSFIKLLVCGYFKMFIVANIL